MTSFYHLTRPIVWTAKEVNRVRDFLKENWRTILLAAVTTIAIRLLLGW